MSDKRINTPKDFNFFVNQILKNISKTPQYSALTKIYRNWDNIIDNEFLKFCYPLKITIQGNYGTLFVISNNSATSFYINNNKNYILSKINTYFGQNTITKLIIKEIPMIIKEEFLKKKKNKLTQEQIDIINEIKIDNDKNDVLTNSLKDLATSVFEYKDI